MSPDGPYIWRVENQYDFLLISPNALRPFWMEKLKRVGGCLDWLLSLFGLSLGRSLVAYLSKVDLNLYLAKRDRKDKTQV